MNRISLIAIGVVLGGGVAFAQAKKPFTAAEMQALLGKGLVVNSMDLEGGKHFTGRVNLEAGGKLSGTLTVSGQRPIALSGVWQLKAAQLCRTLEARRSRRDADQNSRGQVREDHRLEGGPRAPVLACPRVQ